MIEETIDMLGLRAKDKITGFDGVITTVAFDLFGCCQITLMPTTASFNDKFRLPTDGPRWFDVSRIEPLGGDRVMPVPDFRAIATKPAEFAHGAAEKPPLH